MRTGRAAGVGSGRSGDRLVARAAGPSSGPDSVVRALLAAESESTERGGEYV